MTVKDQEVHNARRRERYATDPEYRAKTLAENARYADENRERINAQRCKRYQDDPEYRRKCRERVRRSAAKRKARMTSQTTLEVKQYPIVKTGN